jgi:hypothetical protein
VHQFSTICRLDFCTSASAAKGNIEKGLTAEDVSNAQHSTCPFGDWQHYRRLASSCDTERSRKCQAGHDRLPAFPGERQSKGRYWPAFVHMSLKQSFYENFLAVLMDFACSSNLQGQSLHAPKQLAKSVLGNGLQTRDWDSKM